MSVVAPSIGAAAIRVGYASIEHLTGRDDEAFMTHLDEAKPRSAASAGRRLELSGCYAGSAAGTVAAASAASTASRPRRCDGR